MGAPQARDYQTVAMITPMQNWTYTNKERMKLYFRTGQVTRQASLWKTGKAESQLERMRVRIDSNGNYTTMGTMAIW